MSAVMNAAMARLQHLRVHRPAPRVKPCSFERIYFSRGNDAVIYQQRKRLGEKLVPQLIEAIDNDFAHTVLSFIPNTAETAYFGFLDGLRKAAAVEVKEALMDMLKARRSATRPSSTHRRSTTGRAAEKDRAQGHQDAHLHRAGRPGATSWCPASMT